MKANSKEAREIVGKLNADLNAAFPNRFYLDRGIWPTNKRNDSIQPVIVVSPKFPSLNGFTVSTTIPGSFNREFATFSEVCEFIRKYI